ncbi:hypothetical protein N9821_02005 [Akkermansiaceae bacterium]|nr:hypothetical protein [Akkermansiaceae bacterium]
MAMVLGTVGLWYVGDVLYNDFGEYLKTLGSSSLTSAWWQVLWFVVAFGMMVKPLHGLINAKLAGRRSHAMAYFETNRLRRPEVQRRIDILGGGLLGAWLILMVIGLVRVEGDVIGLFAPYLGERANPWARGQIGGGFSAAVSLAGYLQIFLTSSFGVLAALALHPKTRNIALIVCALALPYYIFSRTRNTMLATMLPGIMAFVFMRVRGGLLKKGCLLFGFFILVNFWFTVVMANREGMSFDIDGALSTSKESLDETRHEGLNMLEELAWIDRLIKRGTYFPNFGERYFAELVNPIPRGLWKNKPMIGLDYAEARGFAGTGSKGETVATMSTGMIGQGVVNFGRIGGPLAAAFLMALWVSLLARQDLLGSDPARLILYGTGLMLTINLGRDITLLTTYPFFFGLGLLWFWNRFLRPKEPAPRRRKKVRGRAKSRREGRKSPRHAQVEREVENSR